MKLLTTIAAVLISISAFSQNYVDYNEGTFSRNGEELSMERVKDLVKHFNVGGPNFRRAKKYLRLAQKPNPAVLSNTLNGIGGVAAGFVSLGGFAFAPIFLIDEGQGQGLDFYHPPTGFAFIALGTVSASTATYLFSNIGNKQAFELRANKQFKKVAYKLNNKVAENINQAIKAANQ
jgi:hypothetical protein